MNDEVALSAKLEALRAKVVPLAENTVTRYIGQSVEVGCVEKPLVAAALAELMGEAAAEMCGFTRVEAVVEALGLVIQALAVGNPNIGVTMLVGEEAEAFRAQQEAAPRRPVSMKFAACPECVSGKVLWDHDDGGQWLPCKTCDGRGQLHQCPTCEQTVPAARSAALQWPQEPRHDET